MSNCSGPIIAWSSRGSTTENASNFITAADLSRCWHDTVELQQSPCDLPIRLGSATNPPSHHHLCCCIRQNIFSKGNTLQLAAVHNQIELVLEQADSPYGCLAAS